MPLRVWYKAVVSPAKPQRIRKEETMEQTKRKKKRKPVRRRGRLKQLIPYLAIILVAAALVTAVILVTGRKGLKDDADPSAIELNRTTSADGTDNSRVERDTNPQIAEIITRYFRAAKDADADTLNQIVETDIPFDQERLKMESEYVESYNNISCYTISGIVDHTYIVYVSYDLKLRSIDTKAPSLVRFYVCENEDGSMYIDNRAKDGEVSAYMQEVANWQEIRDLNTEVNNRYKAALDSDEKLREFCSMLNGESTGTAAADGAGEVDEPAADKQSTASESTGK